jgi:hypothetical protein
MAAIAPPQHSVVPQIYAAYEAREAASGGHRAHLGASVIGHACDRHLWLHFRWAARSRFDGRMLRLFNTGQRAEDRFVDELRGIGIEVHATDEFGRQHRVSAHGGHFGGSLDGAAVGLPEAPKAWHVLEFKTHNDKSFKDLVAKGVQAAKPMHWAQTQVYMGLTGMDRALYLAENKNTSELHAERVAADPVAAAQLLARAERVITASVPPARLSADPARFECKFCDYHPLCHGQQVAEVNCRTCAHSTPVVQGEGGQWRCNPQELAIDDKLQRTGCTGHRFIPVLLENLGQPSDTTTEANGNLAVHYTAPDGSTFTNGAAPGFSSTEIHAAKHKAMLGDPTVQAVKQQFATAEVVA